MRLASVLLLAIMVGSAPVTYADELGLVKLKNHFQEQVATQVLGTAFTRVENSFLVSVTESEQELLARAGIELQIIQSDVDIEQLALVMKLSSPDPDYSALSSLGAAVQLGAGMQLVQISRAEAHDLSQTTDLSATVLADLEIRFKYLPPAIITRLSDARDYFPTDTLVNLISQDSIFAMNQRLEDFQTRYIWTDSINAARDWLVQKFTGWGYTNVTTQQLWWNGGWHYNVVCVKEGYAEPDKVIVVGGHYDSITYGQPEGPYIYAPGADDDGSGTTLTLELARILATVPTRKTIIFVPFTAEEVGLVGSRFAAQTFVANGTDVEVMFNYDMVGYVEDPEWPLNLSSGSNTAYRDLSSNAALRLTSLTPQLVSLGSSSDHYAFHEQGFNVCDAIEGNFNNAGWHTNLDITSRMDFGFMTDVVKTALASIAIVANAAHPTDIDLIVDIGDGQSLEVYWSSCDLSYSYTLYYGPASGVYTDTVIIPAGVCSWQVDGLTTGQEYFFSVVGLAPEGYPALYALESSQTPYVVPRAPLSLGAEPGLSMITIDWADNIEADISHYRVYRRLGEFEFALLEDNVSSSDYVDTQVQGQIDYGYAVTAVDWDGYESSMSNQANATPATFDHGILIADAWSFSPGSPAEAVQAAFFDSVFAGVSQHAASIDNAGDRLTRSQAGPYSSVFWIDDDVSAKSIADSEDTLAWYCSFANNLFVDGFRVIPFWEESPLSSADFMYNEFRVSAYVDHAGFDFAGATGAVGWPDIEVGPNSPFGPIPNVQTLTLRSGGVPIYFYDSQTDDPGSEGLPCAVAYDGPSGKRILLAFPIYWLTEQSARNLIQTAVVYFGETGSIEYYGDLDGNGVVDIGDLVYFVNYAFLGGPAPVSLNAADVNGSCQIDISDLVYLVNYMFHSGPDLVAGCVE
ncbi:MAG: M20/M25/M40 family metallo-hydrolase [bacterium]